MNIGFVCSEYFSSREINGNLIPTSAHGGFGFLTRAKAEFLASLGHTVHVFTYSSNFYYGKKGSFELIENGVKIHLVPERERVGRSMISTGLNYLLNKPKENGNFLSVINKEELQILQFEDTPTTLLLANIASLPKILVFQDPFDYYDINLLIDSDHNYRRLLEDNNDPYIVKKEDEKFHNQIIINFLHKKNFVKPIREIIDHSKFRSVFAEADFIGTKVKKMFSLNYTPLTIRNPVELYENCWEKTRIPSFVWVGRWDPQKRVDTMLRVASELPEYDFYLIGTATEGANDYALIEKHLIEKFSKYSNIHILGFIDEFTKRERIGRSWALINTSIREGLPITFLEAMAEGTPIVSYVDPDSYVSRFGIKVNYSIESFKEGIERSVQEKLYERIGEKEREFIRREHEISVVMKRHNDIYKDILGDKINEKNQ
ncbi:MAG: glycosyltransferase family 4 protein [Thermoplasmatales archaeon]